MLTRYNTTKSDSKKSVTRILGPSGRETTIEEERVLVSCSLQSNEYLDCINIPIWMLKLKIGLYVADEPTRGFIGSNFSQIQHIRTKVAEPSKLSYWNKFTGAWDIKFNSKSYACYIHSLRTRRKKELHNEWRLWRNL